MSVTHPTTVRNTLADAVVDQLDSGYLVFYQADGTNEVATCPLDTTAFDAAGTAGAGIATAGTITPDSSATGGTTTIAKLETSANVEIARCTVGTSGADINLSNNVIGINDTVTVTALTYEAAP